MMVMLGAIVSDVAGSIRDRNNLNARNFKRLATNCTAKPLSGSLCKLPSV